MPRFTVLPVAGALGLDDIRRYPQCDLPVGDTAASGAFRVAMLDAYVIAEEPRRLAAGVGDQCLAGFSSSPRVSRRNLASVALIFSASAFDPMSPSSWSSAYLI